MEKLLKFLLTFFVANCCYAQNVAEHQVLWIGTSIPAGCPYPQNSCKNLGWECYNQSLGASGIIKHEGYLNNAREGLDLCETIDEKENRYRPYVVNGSLTENELSQFKTYGFESRVIPYIDGTLASCNIVVIDHGFNDRESIYQTDQYAIDDYKFDFDLPDSAYNRSTYLCARESAFAPLC